MKDKQMIAQVVELLKRGTVTKQSIMSCLNVTERATRRILSRIAKEYPLIALSNNEGYRIATAVADEDEARHAYNENAKRAAEILKRNEPLRRFLKAHARSDCLRE